MDQDSLPKAFDPGPGLPPVEKYTSLLPPRQRLDNDYEFNIRMLSSLVAIGCQTGKTGDYKNPNFNH
jgi:hypothetical protein